MIQPVGGGGHIPHDFGKNSNVNQQISGQIESAIQALQQNPPQEFPAENAIAQAQSLITSNGLGNTEPYSSIWTDLNGANNDVMEGQFSSAIQSLETMRSKIDSNQ